MRVLILSSNNGGGHNAVAQALKQVFEAHGDLCRVEDCLSFISEDVSEAVAKSHSFMYRHVPKLFDSGYRHTLNHPKTFMQHHNGRRMLNLGRKNLGRTIQKGGYDAVLCTHVFASIMLTDARAKYDLPVVTGVVETDYTASPGTQAGSPDWHFIPAESLKEGLAALGVPRERIIASGIPVTDAFYRPSDSAQARRSLGLNPNCRHLLVMGSSMGAGPLPELAAELAALMGPREVATFVCGTNRALEEALRAAWQGDQRFRILGYEEDVSQLMEASDLLITKPGGITVTEAAMKGLPMVLVDAVAGCEAYNLDFFVNVGGAVSAEGSRALARLAVDILRDDARRGDMARALEPIVRANDREIIWRTMHGI